MESCKVCWWYLDEETAQRKAKHSVAFARLSCHTHTHSNKWNIFPLPWCGMFMYVLPPLCWILRCPWLESAAVEGIPHIRMERLRADQRWYSPDVFCCTLSGALNEAKLKQAFESNENKAKLTCFCVCFCVLWILRSQVEGNCFLQSFRMGRTEKLPSDDV